MTGHPAVEAAAVALLLGWDPLAFLRAEGIDREISGPVVRRAQELRGEELRRHAEAVGHYCAVALSQMFR